MKRANVLGAALVITGVFASAPPAQAQAIGADASLFSAYVWRGLSLTNKPVLEPDVYVTFPAGKASITLGGWANIDLGKYDDLNDDISESGAISSFNFAEFDPWVEASFPVGEKTTLTGGVTAYIYPNDADKANNDFGLLTSDANTVEIYGKAAFDVPLSPKLAVWYDVDKINGAYFEASVSHTIPASEKVGVALGAVAGFSAGQGVPDSGDDSSNFDDDGFTHLDLSAGVPLTAGVFSITPVVHLVINGDERVKITSPTNTSDAKLWGGVTVSWSKDYGETEEDAATTE